MSDVLPVAVLKSGAELRPPLNERYEALPGEVSSLEADTTAVSTSGPSVALTVGFFAPQAAGREQVCVVRVRVAGRYLRTSEAEWRDPNGNLSVSAIVTVPDDGVVEGLGLVLPYEAFPSDTAGTVEVEVAVHEPSGRLSGLGGFSVELPDVTRSPDALTVIAHTLVALCRVVDGELSMDELETIERLLRDDFGLDALGDRAMARALDTALDAEHVPATLAEVLGYALPAEFGPRLVDLLYATARADGVVDEAEQAFVSELLAALGIHDHVKMGPEHLRAAWDELELAPGATADDVKKAWKRLLRDYHPDRVQHLARGFQEYATRKSAAINDAYRVLKEVVGAPGASADEPGGPADP